MKEGNVKQGVLLVGLLICTLVFGGLAAAAPRDGDSLEVYTTVVDSAKAGELTRQGYDLIATRTVAGDKVEVDLILSVKERDLLTSRGLKLGLKKTANGKTPKQLAAAQAASGYTVWRSWDQPGGIRDELYSVAQQFSGFAKLEVIGRTIQGREIIALKVTQGAKGT